MKFRFIVNILFAAILSTSFVTVAQGQGISSKDVEAIRAQQAAYRQAWLRNDEAAVLSIFSDDATLYPGGGAAVRGKAEMKKFWFAPSDTITVINKFDDDIEEITGDRNFAAMTGTNTIHWTSEKRDKTETKRYVSKSTFIALLRRQGNEWKVVKQIWHAKTEEIK